MGTRLTPQERKAYEEAMAAHHRLQEIHEQDLKARGAWHEPGEEDEEESIYDDPLQVLSSDEDLG